MPDVGGPAFRTRGRRHAAAIVGCGLLAVACGTPPHGAPDFTYGSTAAPAAVADDPVHVGQAATLASGAAAGDGTLVVGGGAVDTVGGLIVDGQKVTPFDVANPIISRLDPLLRKAIQDAARRAQADGVTLQITSGWRSRGFQQRLFDDAVRSYGSSAMAAQFVASPDESKHVLGEAVDVGPAGADEWLMRNSAQFGLCQIYANEIWHFEHVADAQGKCPPLKPNAAG